MTSADLLFTGGPVFDDPTGATQLAVKDGRILATGHDLSELRGRRTETVELAGRLLIPGFQDAHVHAVMGGVELGRCDLTGTTDIRTYQDRIAAYARDQENSARTRQDNARRQQSRKGRSRRDEEWILGGGWSLESFPRGVPVKELLDAVVPDRPVFLMNRDHHAAWVNSRALELAGITAATPDPPNGRIDRDAAGEPVGALQESAMDLIPVPATTPAELRDGLRRAERLLLSYGITTWQDAMLCATNGYPDVSDAYEHAARTGRMTVTVVGALWWDRERGLDQVPDLLAQRQRLTVGRLSAGTVKLMLDGVAENFTAAMTAPYRDACGHPTGNRGMSFIDPAALKAIVTRLDAEGFQTHFHALGDRAVRDALDALAAARDCHGDMHNRPHLAHLQVVHPRDVPRFAELGATANIQPFWAAHEPQMDELTLPFLDPELARHQYPFGDLERAGARLAGGSDWPVSTADPLQGIHVAVNRVLPEADHERFLPDQVLSLGTALRAYTAGSAYVNHRDDTGALRPGMRADLAVLDADPFAGPPEAIAETRVALTYVDGRRVYPG